jgi:hypothetical protein
VLPISTEPSKIMTDNALTRAYIDRRIADPDDELAKVYRRYRMPDQLYYAGDYPTHGESQAIPAREDLRDAHEAWANYPMQDALGRYMELRARHPGRR